MSRKNNRKLHRARHEAAIKWEKEEEKRRQERLKRRHELRQLTQDLEKLSSTTVDVFETAAKRGRASPSTTVEESATSSETEDRDMDGLTGKGKGKEASTRLNGTKVRKIICKDARLKKRVTASLPQRKANSSTDGDDTRRPVALVRGNREGVKEIKRSRDKKILRRMMKRKRVATVTRR